MKIRPFAAVLAFAVFAAGLLLSVSACTPGQTASYADAAVIRVVRESMDFRMGLLWTHADDQWQLLVENNFAGRPDMVAAAQRAIEMYARSLILSPTERIFAMDNAGNVVMYTGSVNLRDEEREPLMRSLSAENHGLQEAIIGGERKVFQVFHFAPFRWYVLISERRDVFYRAAALKNWPHSAFTPVSAGKGAGVTA